MGKILKKDGSSYQFLVSWKDMMKDSEEPLPLRPFNTREEAEAYILGCSDVIVMQSTKEIELNEVVNDFEITMSQ